MMHRLLLRREKSCRECRGLEGGLPCYECTFNLKHPPPQYTSLPRHHPHAHGTLSQGGQEPTKSGKTGCLSHSYLDYHSPVPMPLLPDPDFDVTSLAHGIGRIGLAVAALSAHQQTDTLQLPESGRRSRHYSDPGQGALCPHHATIGRNTSAPELKGFPSQDQHSQENPQDSHNQNSQDSHNSLDTQDPQRLQEPQEARMDTPDLEAAPEEDPHLLLAALTTRVSDTLLTQSPPACEHLVPSEASPLPCQLLIPE